MGLHDHIVGTECPSDDKVRFAGLLLRMYEGISLLCEQSQHSAPVHRPEIKRLSNLSGMNSYIRLKVSKYLSQ